MAEIVKKIRKAAKTAIRVKSSRGKSERVEVVRQRTKFTDLNLDCLEKIFDRLTLRDLLNAADSSADFRNALRPVFELKYKSKLVTMEKMRHSSRRPITIDRDGILIEDNETSFQFLRCFGDLISKLKLAHWPAIAGDNLRNQLGRVVNLIGQNCGENLEEITILDVQWIIWLDMKKCFKPFWNVQSVHIEGSMMREGMLNRLFPNMKSLTCVVNSYREQFGCLVGHFHHLKHLDVKVERFDLRDDWSLNCVQRCIALNRQLTSLRVQSESASMWKLEFTSPDSTKVAYFKYQYDYRIHRNKFTDLAFQIDAKKITNSKFGVGFVWKDNLSNRTFILECNNCKEISESRERVKDFRNDLMELLNENGLIRKLTVNSTNRITAQNCNTLTEGELKVIGLLTSLQGIELNHCSVTTDQVITITTKMKQLNSFSFDISTEEYKKLSKNQELECEFKRKTLTNESEFVTVKLTRL